MNKLLTLSGDDNVWFVKDILDGLSVPMENRAKSIFDATHVLIVHYCFENELTYMRLEFLAKLARFIGKKVLYIEDMETWDENNNGALAIERVD